jgi:serine/threonine-protein kinase
MNEILYFVMEFINGKTLADMIKEKQNLDISKGLKYFITVCLALDFVSKMNIIHRDVKPENIMITDRGMLKIVDFGVAKITDGKKMETNSDGIVGSPLYISPDCIKGLPVDCRSDIYSLGATFYHAFSGFPPFEGKNVEDVLRKHLNDELVPLPKRNPNISPALSRIIERMMNKEPENRYQNYQSIVDDLEALKAGTAKFQ